MPRFARGLVLLVLGCVGCSSEPQATSGTVGPASKPQVFVVSYPLAYFAERIGGDAIAVVLPVPDGVDPANWHPDGEAIAEFQSADLVLLNGADYAQWTLRATLPWSRTVITTRDVEDRYIEVTDAVTHSHGPEGEHEHGGIVSETWLDPELAIAQALVIRQALQQLIPEAEDAMEANFDSLRVELQRLDKEMEAVFAKQPGPWMASHPVYDYLGRRYALDLQSMHWEPDETPTETQWQELEQRVESRPAPFMLWEDQPTAETAARLQQLGVTIVVFLIGDRRPATGDYLDMMQGNLKSIGNAIADRPSTP